MVFSDEDKILFSYCSRRLQSSIAPDLWLPNSPDVNPVDYRVWSLIQERVYKTVVCDTADLKQRLIESWSSIPQTVIDEASDEWGL